MKQKNIIILTINEIVPLITMYLHILGMEYF